MASASAGKQTALVLTMACQPTTLLLGRALMPLLFWLTVAPYFATWRLYAGLFAAGTHPLLPLEDDVHCILVAGHIQHHQGMNCSLEERKKEGLWRRGWGGK